MIYRHKFSSRFISIFAVFAMLATFMTGLPLKASADSSSTWRSTVPHGNDLYSVANNGSLFVAVGAAGTIMTSTDAINWNLQTSGTTNTLYAVTFGNNMFVAVGSSGTILTSTNGVSWESQNSGNFYNLMGIACGNGVFVAISGVIVLTSSDGKSWAAPAQMPMYTGFYGITYSEGMFLATGIKGCILMSYDGKTWKFVDSGTNVDLYAASVNGGSIIAIGDSGTVLKSTDVSSWKTWPCGRDNLRRITYGNNRYVIISDLGIAMVSPDGETWTPHSTGFNYISGITYGNNMFVAVGAAGVILTSTNGADWSIHSPSTSHNLYGVAYGGNTYVAVGDKGTFLTSTNSVNWTALFLNTTALLAGVTYGNNKFVAVGSSGTILTSPGGNDWTGQNAGTFSDLKGITYGGRLFVAVGDLGTILTSPDGITWTKQNTGTTTALLGITYGGGMFVAVGAAGTILTSTDGASWTAQKSRMETVLHGVAYGNNIFIAVGDYKLRYDFTSSTYDWPILTSTDGTTWKALTTNSMRFHGIVFDGSHFTALGEGKLLNSVDGTSWSPQTFQLPAFLNGIIYTGSIYLAVGDSGTILTTANPDTPSFQLPEKPTGISSIFTDVQNHWALPYMQYLYDKGIRTGYADKTMRPETAITRAETAAAIVLAIGLKPADNISMTFSDSGEIPGWAKGYIQTALNIGLMKGYDDNTVRAGGNVTRNEAAVMLQRGFRPSAGANQPLPFSDSIPDWAKDAISSLMGKGAISGYPDNSFQGDNNVTNAEFDKMICVLMGKSQ